MWNGFVKKIVFLRGRGEPVFISSVKNEAESGLVRITCI